MSTLIALEAAAHIVTVIAGTLVVYQLYLFLKQQRRAAFEKTHDTTRQLILVGMDRPELLELLSGGHLICSFG